MEAKEGEAVKEGAILMWSEASTDSESLEVMAAEGAAIREGMRLVDPPSDRGLDYMKRSGIGTGEGDKKEARMSAKVSAERRAKIFIVKVTW